MAWARLVGAAWILLREGALLPIEHVEAYPPAVGAAARVLRGLSARRDGRPGERLARAFGTRERLRRRGRHRGGEQPGGERAGVDARARSRGEALRRLDPAHDRIGSGP